MSSQETGVDRWAKPIPGDQPLPRRTADCMPAYSSVPEEFKDRKNPWVAWQQEWFFNGLKSVPTPKDGIDKDSALRHLAYIQGSWDTAHEHKECAVAYLASRWFKA
jgi:hypothetical protein